MRRKTRQKGMKELSEREVAVLAAAGQSLSAGRATEAVAGFHSILQAHPRRADLHNNLGVALRAAGRPDEAVASYRQAIKLDPGYGAAQGNLARVLRDHGHAEEAVGPAEAAWRLSPDDPDALSALAETLAACRFSGSNPAARRALMELYRRDDVDQQALAAAAVSLVLADPRRAGLITGSSRPTLKGLSNDALLTSMLTWSVLPSPEIEHWITALRRWLLLERGIESVRSADGAFLAAIACQCHLTEYAYQVTQVEWAALDALVQELEGTLSAEATLAAMYRPLSEFDVAGRFAALAERAEAADRGARAEVLRRQFTEPAEEAILARDLPVLGAVGEGVSSRVRDQYEANPYPRWRSVDRVRRVALAEHLGSRFPELSLEGLNMGAPEILVAGCGTGRHAVMTAARYRGAQVLAVDLSRASLAHAIRMARTLGVDNLEFAQADLLALGDLDRRFDMIECSGVLHHLADPLAGGQVLRGLLKPGGIMRLALYSERARSVFYRFQAPIDPMAGSAEAQIRTRRAEILALPDADPARVLTRTADFYALSGVRDALFHEQEHCFTPLGVRRLITGMELTFLGFEGLSDPLRAAFRNETDGVENDLAAWDDFEERHPEIFLAMYQFWCQAAS